MNKILHQTDFEAQLKKTFQVHSDEHGPVKLTLEEVSGRNREGIEAFSLLFKGPKDPVMRQKLRKIKQNKLGTFTLFMVPVVSGEQNAIMYQSIINRKATE